jgi:3-keto-disaccharide hydrolase
MNGGITMTAPLKLLPLFLILLAAAPEDKPANSLTTDEKDAGWKLLFDGKTTDGWRGYQKDSMPPGWKVIDGLLVRVSGGAGGKGAGGGDDIVTVEQFDNFELALEWKIVDKAGNSGAILRASEDAQTSWHTGPEMQILDNAAYPGRDVRQLAGACYDLYAPPKDVSRPLGEWNAVRVVANGRHVEHWLNGVKLVEYELGSDDWKARVAKSKFKEMKHFLEPPTKGHICLQDHTARIEYRNIKIRPLPPKT